MIAKVKFSCWDFHPNYHKDLQKRLASFLLENGYVLPECESSEDKEAFSAFEKFLSEPFQLDIVNLTSARLPFSVEGCENREMVNDFFSMMLVLIKDNIKPPVTNHNTITINTPDTELHKFNECMVEEECCTDELQKHLNDGWRIISVCMQKGSRRPDYVLGRVRQ